MISIFLKRRGLTLLWVSVTILISNTTCADVNPGNQEIQILFVGNSLTYTNNLPDLVAKIGKSKGKEIETTVLALPNYALEDHWNDGRLQRLIKKGEYAYVVVQQGPSSQKAGRLMLLDYGQRIQDLCQENNTKLAFFMVWPALANYSTFDGVIRNYTEAATKTGALLCPVGKVWRDHFNATQNFSYYGDDQFHPSMAGSTVAAETIYASLF